MNYSEFTNLEQLLAESKKSTQYTININLNDPDKQLIGILEHIKANSDPGHSFTVVVDPDGDSEQKKSFGIDGDGSFNIKSIEVIENDAQ